MVTNQSILISTKKVLGIDESYDVFDVDILMHINTAFFTLMQLGVGPEEGFSVLDAKETWEDFTLGDKNLEAIKSYVFIRVRLLFDPPNTSFSQEALKKQAEELEWRLEVYSSNLKYTPEEENNDV